MRKTDKEMKNSYPNIRRPQSKVVTFAVHLKMMEMARRAAGIIALAKQKIRAGQAAKMKSFQ